jgi:hypothetical protein
MRIFNQLRQRMNGNALKCLIFHSGTFGMAVTTRPILLLRPWDVSKRSELRHSRGC